MRVCLRFSPSPEGGVLGAKMATGIVTSELPYPWEAGTLPNGEAFYGGGCVCQDRTSHIAGQSVFRLSAMISRGCYL